MSVRLNFPGTMEHFAQLLRRVLIWLLSFPSLSLYSISKRFIRIYPHKIIIGQIAIVVN